MPLSRRALLSMPLLLPGCAARRTLPARSPALPRVNVAPDRVIRTTVGLRPFRPSGFVVRAEKLDAKTVVHNYGHGGAGITLSWGTAQLAVEEGARTGIRECAVIGSGVVGLSTARLLQLRGYRPVIYARELPPLTTSNVAGGLWEPVSVFDLPRVTPEFRRQYVEASRFAFRRYQSLAGERYGVRWLPLYSLSTVGPMAHPRPENPNSEVEPLYPEGRQLERAEHSFDLPFAYHRYSMLIEPAIYLKALLDDFQIAGGRVEVREFASAREIAALPENLIFNCTGLGARALFNDQELTPIRGQLVVLLPQPEVQYMTLGPSNIYMFPRRDGIVLGGSFDADNWSLEPDAAISERILRENGVLFKGMRAR